MALEWRNSPDPHIVPWLLLCNTIDTVCLMTAHLLAFMCEVCDQISEVCHSLLMTFNHILTLISTEYLIYICLDLEIYPKFLLCDYFSPYLNKHHDTSSGFLVIFHVHPSQKLFWESLSLSNALEKQVEFRETKLLQL